MAEKRDINEIFDDIVLIEERLMQQGYKEGFEQGSKEGQIEGFKLGYSQGVQLGKELGNIYGFILAQQQKQNTEKVLRTLAHLKDLISKFPKTNDPDKNIIEDLDQIRQQFKKLNAMLCIRNTSKELTTKKPDLSF